MESGSEVSSRAHVLDSTLHDLNFLHRDRGTVQKYFPKAVLPASEQKISKLAPDGQGWHEGQEMGLCTSLPREHLLKTYYVPDTVLGTGDIMVK